MGDKVPSVGSGRVVAALERLGFFVSRQRGSHIRLEKPSPDGTIKITVPSHRQIKRSTLSHILKQAGVSLQEFLDAL